MVKKFRMLRFNVLVADTRKNEMSEKTIDCFKKRSAMAQEEEIRARIKSIMGEDCFLVRIFSSKEVIVKFELDDYLFMVAGKKVSEKNVTENEKEEKQK